MPSVTGYTTDKVDALIADAVVSGAIDSGTGELTLTTKDGTVLDVGSITDGIADSSTTHKGVVELATDVETIAGTDTARAVTPFGMAAVVSSATARGLVELATNAETLTGTDATRAVTPAGLASIPGTKIVTGLLETALPTAFPSGVSLMTLSASAWSLNSGTGVVVTTNPATDFAEQRFYVNNGTGKYPRSWVRQYKTSDGGWSTWAEYSILNTLVPASFTQTTAFTSYPQGHSRLYYTTSNSTSWDFAGKAGEILTYRDGTDFAKQTWTRHLGGSTTGKTETWIRTATSADGWTPWLITSEDTGWVSLGTLAAGYTLKLANQVRRINNVAYLRGAFTVPNSNFTSSGLIIPTGFRPSADIAFPVTSNTAVNFSGAIVASTGVIQTWADGTSSSSFHISGVNYPIG